MNGIAILFAFHGLLTAGSAVFSLFVIARALATKGENLDKMKKIALLLPPAGIFRSAGTHVF